MKNQTDTITPKEFLKTIGIIYLALLTGLIGFGIYIFLQKESWQFKFNNESDPFFYLVPLLAISGIFMGQYLFNKQISTTNDKESLREKLSGFQAAAILQYALIEGPAMLGLVASLKTGNLLYITISGLLILYFIMLRPGKERIEKHLRLSQELKKQFEMSEHPLS
ncbi:hypothetical protein [Zhouia amylolytica]|uniref:hypothetical protein n=1 Tax=Zhouia amylolytica TaxID=376730 RepID=UPI0020CE035B|nr:hypothetical protein [Zhouia amylolytica]MCQ0111704.1 hypothetical protein [Zhouia amylolytica]